MVWFHNQKELPKVGAFFLDLALLPIRKQDNIQLNEALVRQVEAVLGEEFETNSVLDYDKIRANARLLRYFLKQPSCTR
jgi:hypothetical protein